MRVGSLALAATLATACGHLATSASPPPAGDPLIDARLGGHGLPAAEYLRWRITWAGVLVGRLEQASGRPGRVAGRPALILRSAGESDGLVAIVRPVRGELVTTLDLARGLPIDQAGSFDQLFSGTGLSRGEAQPLGPPVPWDPGGADAPVHNAHSVMALLRAWRPVTGERGHCFVRIDHTILRLDLRAVGSERITTRFGRRSALRIDGEARSLASGHRFPMVAWIDLSPARVLLRLQVEAGIGGVVQLDLDAYQGPADLELDADAP